MKGKFSMIATAALFVTFMVSPFPVSLAASIVYLIYRVKVLTPSGLNPFEEDDRRPRQSHVIDQKVRDGMLKQGFSSSKVPDNLDAIVVGSGIGGLSAAAILSKSGKKVLVLEQHDQAGGCCHTFIDHGYEFDVGVHYVGKMADGEMNRFLFDQITNGQLEWTELDKNFDQIAIDYDEKGKRYRRNYLVTAPHDDWKTLLKIDFPEETRAIDDYFTQLENMKRFDIANGLLKFLPLYLVKFLTMTRLIHVISNLWTVYFSSTQKLVYDLTDNVDLRTIFYYSWGNFGTPPPKSPFMMQAGVVNHFQRGAFYPVGGGSEIAFNIIPVIERSGGKVLVKVAVDEIVFENGKAVGVRAIKGHESLIIRAPVIISDAGLYNTFQNLVPRTMAKRSYYYSMASEAESGCAAMNVYLGLSASNEQLQLPRRNTWAFTEAGGDFEKYYDLPTSEVMDADIPVLYISFPSAKDPQWPSHPGRENKSTCAIITMASWKWFDKFKDTKLKKRGDEYDELKSRLGHKMIEQACALFPQIRQHIDFVDIGSPISNRHYLMSPHGEIYGLGHSMTRFSPMSVAGLRAETDLPGLFLTGQDILTTGIVGGLFGGCFCAGAVLKRNTIADLESLHNKLYGITQ